MLPIRTILHPTDFSVSSAAAFQFACALARDYSARLVVLHVYPTPTAIEWPDDSHEKDYEAALMPQLLALKPSDPSVRVQHRLVEGGTVGTILKVADEEKCDLIVMGTHGRTGLGRTLMGSVAEAVHRQASCPVATVRSSVHLAENSPPPAAEPVAAAAAIGVDPTREAFIPYETLILRGTLQWIGKPEAVVVFAHGSGSSRFSPRNRYVAGVLNQAGFATLLLDLLTEEEAEDRGKVFDVQLLAARLSAAAAWVLRQPETAGLPVGLFGASTGSAAALIAAATHPERVAAVVSRGGRPDLAWEELPSVHAPVLLIVGGDDEPVLTWNREALEQIGGVKRLEVVPGATHLFEEPGALRKVADLARDWFERYVPVESELEAVTS